MTHQDEYTMRAANALPHSDPGTVELTVEQIMEERGIGKRYAYAVLRKLTEEKYADATVPTNQRERVLAMLYRSAGSVPDSRLLMQALQDEGYAIDGHDTTKVLWSLQKTGHVKFREHQNPKYLYAIRLTDLGKTDGRKFATRKKDDNELLPTNGGTMSTVEAPEIRDESTATVEDDGSITQHTHVVTDFVVAATPAVTEQPVQPDEPAVPWFRGNLGGWPSMRDVRDRHQRAVKIRSALALLEEVGEDDAVLALLDKITFTPLEEEVIQLLRFLKEIE